MSHSENTTGMTILANATPIARGTNREVWDRPGHPDQILKTTQIHKRQKYVGRGPLRQAFDHARLGPYGAFRAEYRCYLKTAYACERAGRPIPIAEIGGLVITDHGLAQVCAKITDASGGLAKTFRTLLAEGAFQKDHLPLLNDFVETLFMLNVNVPDLTYANFVLDEKKQQFILIDGYGDRTFIPARAWIKPLNQRQLDVRFAKMPVQEHLRWDATLRKFALP